MLSPLTFSPKANTASPAAKMLTAALISRSWITPHSGHSHDRTFSGRLSLTNPQQAQRLLEGKNLSISTYVLPVQFALYSSWRVNSPQLASAICFASFGFLIRFFTARFSAQITWFSLINLWDNWCKLSIRQSAIFA
ncbi:MAG: hypothetical protein RI964_3224 [Pseudomonadota bacterium]